MTETEPEQVSVKENRDGGRTLFRGAYEDALKFVSEHFPHIHVSPGEFLEPGEEKADVVVQRADKSRESLVGGKWESDKIEPEPEIVPAHAADDTEVV